MRSLRHGAGAHRRGWAARMAWTVMLTGGLAGCGGADGPAPEIRIGLLATMEGRFAESSGDPSLRGAELAVSERNAAGGVVVDGVPHQVRLVVRSYDARADDAAAQARVLINEDSVHALLGPQLSAHAIAVAVMAEEARVVMISPMSSNRATTEGKRFVFRLAFLDDFQGEVLSDFALDELKARTGAVLYEETSPYSSGLAREFVARFQAGGGRIVAEETFLGDAPLDFQEQLGRIARARPDVLLLPNAMAADSVQMRQARELGIQSQILGTDTWDLQLSPNLAAAEGVYVTHQWHYDMEGPEVAPFLRRFDAAYQRLPRTTAAMTYDATVLLLDAMERAGAVGGEPLRAAVAGTRDFQGVTGRISFDGSGSPRRSAVISRVHGGKVSLFRTVDP